MAERRMFAKKIIDSDAFLDMPLSAQALYFHLSMRADDDGFVSNPKKIQRMIGASDDDCKILLLKRYILTFESGIIVIKHWHINNNIRKDRYTETTYIEEMRTLAFDDKGAYVEKMLCQPSDNQTVTKPQPSDNHMTTACQPNGIPGIGKVSIDKYSRLVKILNNNESIACVRENSKNMPQYEPLINEIISTLAYAGSEVESLTFGEREVTREEFERFITKPHGFDGNMLAETANMVMSSSVVIKARRYYILGIIVNHFMR